ncbi:MAG TPA: hypothetical protein VFB80_16270 [Pirellulaceae bacterium]|nr:hypothetical protein [Pirellulaceae bacterium]
MWRAFFLAIGIYLCILGAECLVVDKFVMAAEKPVSALDPTAAPPAPATLFGGTTPAPLTMKKEIEPPEWAPWSLLSAGAVVILYSLTINRQG